MNDEPEGTQVPIVWVGAEDVPILYANTFICQFDTTAPGGFIMTVGQLTPPALIGTPDEVREQAEHLSFVQVRALARMAFTRAKMEDLIAILTENRDRFDDWQASLGGDPRDG